MHPYINELKREFNALIKIIETGNSDDIGFRLAKVEQRMNKLDTLNVTPVLPVLTRHPFRDKRLKIAADFDLSIIRDYLHVHKGAKVEHLNAYLWYKENYKRVDEAYSKPNLTNELIYKLANNYVLHTDGSVRYVESVFSIADDESGPYLKYSDSNELVEYSESSKGILMALNEETFKELTQ